MNAKPMKIPVFARFPSGECNKGSLIFTSQGPQLVIEKGTSDTSFKENILLSVIEGKFSKEIPLSPLDEFEYQSVNVVQKYSPNSLAIQEMYPQS
jgi:hypothetical protein